MSCHKNLGSNWTRRAVLRAGAGLAAYAVTRETWGAETQVAAEKPCVDMPIVAAGDSEHEAALQSPVAAALLHDLGKENVEDNVPAGAAANLKIAFAPGSPLPDTGPSRAAYSRRWGTDVLKVFFQGGSLALKRNVLNKIQEWSNFAKLDFKEATRSADSQIRVNFIAGRGHWSYVGSDADGQLGKQTMNLDMNEGTIIGAYNQGVILHEFGHALGQIHEHQSPASGIKFKPAEQLLAFFRGTGLETAEAIRTNVTNRYQSNQMIRFSEFDPLSIMLYAFPAHMTTDGRGTNQNTVLSGTDQEFAGLIYPGRIKTGGTDPTTKTDTPQTFDLKLGADPIEAKLVAGGTLEFKLTIPSDQGGNQIVIYTSGTTQVVMSLADAAGRDLTPKDVPNHGTPDFMNEVIKAKLAAGDYKIQVVHPSSRGGGSFKIQARTGTFDKLLTSPNRR